MILRGHNQPVTHLSVHGDMLLSCESGHDSDVVLWDLKTQQVIQRFSEHDGGVVVADFSLDGQFYVTCGATGKIYIVETATGDIVTMGDVNPLQKLYFGGRVLDPRGRRLALWHLVGITDEGSILHLIFEPRAARLHQTTLSTSGQKKQVVDVCFAKNDAQLVIAACASGEMLVCDLATEEVITHIQLPGSLGQAFSVSCLTQARSAAPRSIYATYERAESLDEVVAVGGSEFVAVLRGQGQAWDVTCIQRLEGAVVCVDGLDGQLLACTRGGRSLLF